MRFYPFTIPDFAKLIMPSLVWRIDNQEKKEIYLTFDDGPNPEVTSWVLEELKKFDAKATFFVVGENAEKFPNVIAAIKGNGHVIGNHTYNHLSGYSSSNDDYIDNINKCQEITKTNLFRPPYGRIKKSQIKRIAPHFQIVMWNQLSGDFDPSLNRKKSLESLCANAKPGNLVVFHDSVKAFNNLKEILPSFLAFLAREGFICSAIPNHEYLVS
jgi:peptidoglycan/xylan/chitin deacetylase (PgdA/CDA1 family)